MRFIVLVLFLAIGPHLSPTQAAEHRCPPQNVPVDFRGNECVCESGLIKLPDSLKVRLHFPGFKLTSACDAKRVPEETAAFLGKFYLRGTQTLSGRIRMETTEAGGLFLVIPKSTELHPSSYISSELRFFNESEAWKRLGLPQVPVGQGYPCKEAPAQLIVTELAVRLDYGTDYEGTYILSFRPSSVGQFRPCS